MLAAMRTRLLAGGLVAAAVLGLVLWRWRGDGPAARQSATAAEPGAHVAGAGERRLGPGARRMPPRAPARPTTTDRPGTVTVGGVTIEGAGVYDPEAPEVKENLLAFKKSRLRFALYDAAGICWSGGDDVSDVQVAYTMVVEREVLRLENVRLVDSTLPDPALERCILDQLRELRSPADELGDLREDGASWISLHDLYTRNRRNR